MTTLASILPNPTAVQFIRDLDRTHGRETALYWVEQFVGGFVVDCATLDHDWSHAKSGINRAKARHIRRGTGGQLSF